MDLIFLFAILNRARGTKFFEMTTSTVKSRIFSTLLMASTIAFKGNNVILFPLCFIGLMFWCTFAWDEYWAAAIGNGPKSRWWGVKMLGIRGLFLYPTFVCIGILGHPLSYLVGLTGVLQGIPYLIGGIPKKKHYSILIAESLWGACMGAMFLIALEGI
jgi:hypothetical protein